MIPDPKGQYLCQIFGYHPDLFIDFTVTVSVMYSRHDDSRLHRETISSLFVTAAKYHGCWLIALAAARPA